MALPLSSSIALVLCNFLFWGHWPICAKFAVAPSQAFGVIMVFTQTLCSWIAVAIIEAPSGFEALIAESQHPIAIACVVLGGAALAVGDFAAAAAIERLGVAVGGPVCFSFMLVCGSVGDFLLEGSANPALLWCGIAGCLCAVVADSQSHPAPSSTDQVSLTSADSAADSAADSVVESAGAAPSVPQVPATTPAIVVVELAELTDVPLDGGDLAQIESAQPQKQQRQQQQRRRQHAAGGGRADFRLGMTVAIAGGCIGGMWTVLSTLASHAHELSPTSLLFYFHVGEFIFIVPVVLFYGKLFNGHTTLSALYASMRSLTRRQVAWTCAAGVCIAVGYLCYFATKGSVPRPAAYGFGCAAGSTGMVWGLCFFGEYENTPWRKRALLLLAIALFPSSIALIALSMV